MLRSKSSSLELHCSHTSVCFVRLAWPKSSASSYRQQAWGRFSVGAVGIGTVDTVLMLGMPMGSHTPTAS